MSETHWKQNFNYKYTGAYELTQGETRTVTIKRTCTEEVASTNGDKQMCFVAYFEEHNKPMVLNKTNCKTIEKLYGPIIEKWIGKKVIIEAKKVKAFGDMVDALRIKHSLPKVEAPSNFEATKNRINDCTTIDELREVFGSLNAAEKTSFVSLKDKKKIELESAGTK